MDKLNPMQRSPDSNGGEGEENGNEKSLKSQEILNTWKFFSGASIFMNSLKEDIVKSDLSGLENSIIIDMNNFGENNGSSANTESIELAENLYRKNNQNKILLISTFTLGWMQKNFPEIDLLLAKENIKFLRFPFGRGALVLKLRETKNEENTGVQLQELNDKKINEVATRLMHILDREPQKVMSEAKEYFPALVGKSDKEIIDFLQNIRQNVPEVMKGQNIEGVFCDIEGTLFNGEELNNSTLEKLKELEAQGKTITLWTDGDIGSLQTLLDKEGIKYPLMSKIDHAGASAEIVLDNDDQNTFSAKTKIFAKKFIKI